MDSVPKQAEEENCGIQVDPG